MGNPKTQEATRLVTRNSVKCTGTGANRRESTLAHFPAAARHSCSDLGPATTTLPVAKIKAFALGSLIRKMTAENRCGLYSATGIFAKTFARSSGVPVLKDATTFLRKGGEKKCAH